MWKEDKEAKLIKIDTNNENSHKYPPNVELFDIITPHIVGIIDQNNTFYYGKDVDWKNSRSDYTGEYPNGHCVYMKSGGYYSAAEMVYLIVDCKSLGAYANTLSELANNVAKIYKITSWNIINDIGAEIKLNN